MTTIAVALDPSIYIGRLHHGGLVEVRAALVDHLI
jgi:hypothetical protein